MKLQEEYVLYIKDAFSKMKSKDDLLDLLNYSKRLLHGENAIQFKLKHINYHTNPANNRNRYRTFEINKKTGGKRTIYAPSQGLKKIQQCLNIIFQAIYEVDPAAKGFVIGRSIIDNASMHCKKNYVYNIDLKDFFYSIDQARIWGRLKNHPFNLNEKRHNLELANIIASLCCHNIEVERMDLEGNWIKVKKNVLPQGAPTSPIIANIICEQLDYYLTRVAKRFGLSYSRYADDITFSSMHNVYQKDSLFITELNRIIRRQNFHIKTDKTRLQNIDYRQEVTGLIVNFNPNVKKNYIKQLRMWIYYWENYGIERTNQYFLKKYVKDKGDNKKHTPNIENVIYGKLDFLKMVKGETNNTYINLKKRVDSLIKQNQLNIIEEKAITSSITDSEILSNHDISDTIIIDNSLSESNQYSENADNVFQLPIYHQPKELVEILKRFSLNNTALKYATHSWDGGKDEEMFKDFEDFLIKIRLEFKKINNLKRLNKQLWAKILSFLLNKKVGDDGWGLQRIKFGWSSPELLEAMKIEPLQKPENFIMPLYAQFHLRTNRGIQLIQKFQQVIDIFKNEIEIRDENSALIELILEYHDKYLSEFKIKHISNLENKNFYTDVGYLKKALKLVFENIQKRDSYKTISYVLKEDTYTFSLEITHHESFAKGRSIKDIKLSLKSGDMGTIKTWLTNLCDWSIESEFMEGKYRINYLVSDISIKPYVKVNEVEGFKYIFTFYK